MNGGEEEALYRGEVRGALNAAVGQVGYQGLDRRRFNKPPRSGEGLARYSGAARRPEARGSKIAVCVTIPSWQFVLLEGLQEIYGWPRSKAVEWIIKHGFARLRELLDQGAFEGEEEQKLKVLVEFVSGRKNA